MAEVTRDVLAAAVKSLGTVTVSGQHADHNGDSYGQLRYPDIIIDHIWEDLTVRGEGDPEPETVTAAHVTPGQAIHNSLAESAVAHFGMSLEQFQTWDDVQPGQRKRLEAAGQAAIRTAPVVTVERLAEALRNRRILVDVDDSEAAVDEGMWLVTPARPHDLAVQLLTGIDTRLTDDEHPGYWQARTALTTALHALQIVSLGTDDKLAAIARETLARVDAVMEGEPDEAPRAAALRDRLGAAEMVCLIFGWLGSRIVTDEDKARDVLWQRWARAATDGGFSLDPEAHPELGPPAIAELARHRDEAIAQAESEMQAKLAGDETRYVTADTDEGYEGLIAIRTADER